MSSPVAPFIVTVESLHLALDELEKISPLISRVMVTYGRPPAWRRAPGFASLVYTILEQQVSLASARAVYDRLVALCGELTPGRFVMIDDAALRGIGFSRQKTAYCRDVAMRVESGDLDLDGLGDQTDQRVRDTLTGIRGIGPWTADIYLLHSLGRPDVWPVGDLALRIAVQEAMELERRPEPGELELMGDQFRPWRSIAARVFWHGYLTRRGVGEVT
ncbi:MAG: DNA-3-methyladenine glycosylase 2 family protein [Spirochaetales bacterium]|nr:MAG: DNA-3-methyladenine glycosylase 2 family protein [Spirochaetales bacterium]